jgi:hypothetical protein
MRTLNCISYLIQEYSKRSLTVPTDRRIAISALEDRIEVALKDRAKDALDDQCSRYGIFQEFLHRNLLWRAHGSQLQKINYDPNLPSWTWMAYSGAIKFIGVNFGEMEWIDSLRLDEEKTDAIIASLWTFREWTPVHCESHYEVRDSEGVTKGRVYYDLEGDGILNKEYCVVVGREVNHVRFGITTTIYHILVVASTDVDGEYRRVGAGIIHHSHVIRRMANVRIV